MTGPQPDSSFDDLRRNVSEYALIARRRWRLGVLALGTVAAVAFWSSQYMAKEYSARTVFERRDDAVLMKLISSNSPFSFNQLKASMATDMTGTRALANAAVRIGLLEPGTISPEGALPEDESRRLQAALGEYDLDARIRLTTSSPSFDAIELKCTANNPAVAKQFVTALRDQYIDRTQQRIATILRDAHGFFEKEASRVEAAAAAAKAQLSDAFAEYPGVDPTDPSSVGTRLETLRAQRDRIAERHVSLTAEIEARQSFLASAAPALAAEAQAAQAPRTPGGTPVASTTATPLDSAIQAVEAEIDDLLTLRRMTRAHPAVRAQQIKLDALNLARREFVASVQQLEPQEAAQLAQTAVSPIWEGQRLRVQLELDALRKQLAQTTTDLAAANQRYDAFSAIYDRMLAEGTNLRELEASIAAQEAGAQLWRSNLSQLERVLNAQAEERGTQFTLVEEPQQTTRPTRPGWTAVASVSSGLGLAAALLLIALAELLDRSYRSASQVTRSLSIPILDCVSTFDTPRERERRLRQRLLWSPTLGVVVLALVISGAFAYTSVRQPALHQKAIQKVDQVITTFGLPGTQIDVHAPPEMR